MFTYSDTIPDEFNLTIIHTNDVHAHFMQSNARGSPCVQARDLSQKRFNVQHDSGTLKNLEIKSPCFGGAARRATAIRQIRAEKENVLLLDAGDQSQG